MTDATKLRNVRTELDVLTATWRASAVRRERHRRGLAGAARGQRAALGHRGPDPRQGARRPFDAGFIELARAVYVTNDERAAIKKRINTRLGSTLVEEKSYAEYRRPDPP